MSASAARPTTMFQHTAARRRLPGQWDQTHFWGTVSTHSRPKAAAYLLCVKPGHAQVSTHSRPKAAAPGLADVGAVLPVSTHSRPKAAAQWFRAKRFRHTVSTHSRPKAAARARRARLAHQRRFNTQPPEGGCLTSTGGSPPTAMFQHTAARRRLLEARVWAWGRGEVSTHSRPKAAAKGGALQPLAGAVSTHSRPKAAAPCRVDRLVAQVVSTHSRPKAAARQRLPGHRAQVVSTHSRPKAAAGHGAEQRLFGLVSTHSRPKAAAPTPSACTWARCGFNTQPPEGGCELAGLMVLHAAKVSTHSRPKAAAGETMRRLTYQCLFQHTAARRRLRQPHLQPKGFVEFQHTAARRRLPTAVSVLPSGKQFQHTAARRRLPSMFDGCWLIKKFQHTAARRRLPSMFDGCWLIKKFQHTAARRRLLKDYGIEGTFGGVSTHSRPKAAAHPNPSPITQSRGFNTQPPEGGCSQKRE